MKKSFFKKKRKGKEGKRAEKKGTEPSVTRDGSRIIVGFQTVKEALRVNRQGVQKIWLLKGSQKEKSLQKILQNHSCLTSFQHQKDKPVLEKRTISHQFDSTKPSLLSQHPLLVYKSVPFFDKIHSHHQGIAALVKGRPRWNWNSVRGDQSQVFLALDEITDPRNLGALLRLSWLLGVSAVFIPPHRSVSLTPSVSKVACGGSEHVPLEKGPLKTFLSRLKEKNFKILALSTKGKKSLWNIKLPTHLVWLVGSEGKGLHSHLESFSDESIKIPQVVEEASLNVTTAVSMALFETQKQHQSSLFLRRGK